jgi:hypothetical protein
MRVLFLPFKIIVLTSQLLEYDFCIPSQINRIIHESERT